MSSPTWPKLQLFDFSPIRDPYYSSLDALYSDPSLLAIASTNTFLVLAVHNFFLKLVDPSSYVQHAYFAAFDDGYSISHLHPIPSSNLIVAVAERPSFPSLLKVFDLTKAVTLTLSSSLPSIKHHYLTQAQISYKDNAFPISCMLANADISCIAFGYTDGKVIIVRGDLLRDRGSKQRLVFQSVHPITGLHYNPQQDLFYVVTTSEICTIPTTGRNNCKPTTVLAPDAAIDLNCLAIDPFSHELIVADEKTICRYNHSTMTSSVSYPCLKSRVFRLPFKDYLLVVSAAQETNLANGRNNLISTVSILDMRNSIVSFNLILPNIRVTHVLQIMGDTAFISNDGVLHKLVEKPQHDQLELVVQRELFPLALELAKQQHQPPVEILSIMRAYGDYLYSKQNYDESIIVFVRCLEYFKLVNDTNELEDFVLIIITQFKDVSNIANLAKFLRRLYELDAASNEHITLLFCCYCKLKLTSELDSFIDDIDVSTDDSKFQDLNFQLIINLFEECGYSAQMIKLLHKLKQHSLIVGIQLDDLHVPDEALALAKSLPIDDLLNVLVVHSKLFLDSRPIETTQLLINVFTGKYKPVLASDAAGIVKDLAATDNKSNASNAANGHTHSIATQVSESLFPLNSYNSFMEYLSSSGRSLMENSIPHDPTYMPPRPSIVFTSFIDHQLEFVIFIEACLHAYEQQSVTTDLASLTETLLEQYLSLLHQCTHSKNDTGAEDWAQKAQALSSQHALTMDASRLLLLSHLYRFPLEGAPSASAPEQLSQKFTVLQIAGDVHACVALVTAAGNKCPELYKLMLNMASTSRENFEKIGEPGIIDLLDIIYTRKLMAPLEVLDVLCKHQTDGEEFVPVSVVNAFLSKHFDAQDEEISNDKKLIAHYEKESSKASHELSQIVSRPFVLDQKTCSECDLPLDFPLAHFKCSHSYHQRCLDAKSIVFRSLDDTDPSQKHCPQCANQIDDAMRIREALKMARDQYDIFKSRLEESTDRFKFMCGYLGKGLMDEEPTLVMQE